MELHDDDDNINARFILNKTGIILSDFTVINFFVMKNYKKVT